MAAQGQQGFELAEARADAHVVAVMRQDDDGQGGDVADFHGVGGRCVLRRQRRVGHAAAGAVVLRAHAVGVAEDAGEGLGIAAVTAGAGDVRQRFVAIQQKARGVVQADAFQRLVDGLAQNRAVEAVPMVGREAGDVGKTGEVYVVRVVLVQVLQHFGKAGFVVFEVAHGFSFARIMRAATGRILRFRAGNGNGASSPRVAL